MLIELHAHTHYSDGKFSIRQLVDFFAQRNIKILAITDHLCEEKSLLGRAALYLGRTLTRESFKHYIAEIKEEAERAKELYGMLVLPGFEITKNSLQNHRSAHMLAIGVEEYISADLEVEEISKRVRGQGGIFVAAHPISMVKMRKGHYHLWDRREELASYFDAWEITDNGCLLEDVLKSPLPKIATSDFHREIHAEAWRTWVECEAHPQALFEAIRKQEVQFQYDDRSAVKVA